MRCIKRDRLIFIPNLITDDEAWRKFLFLGENGSMGTKRKLHMLFELFPQVRYWAYEKKITHEQLGWLIHRTRESVTRAFGN